MNQLRPKPGRKELPHQQPYGCWQQDPRYPHKKGKEESLEEPTCCTVSPTLIKFDRLESALALAAEALDQRKVVQTEQTSQGLFWEQTLHAKQREWLSQSAMKREQPFPLIPTHCRNISAIWK